MMQVSVRPDSCQRALDLLFLIDGSGSIAAYWEDELDFVKEVIRYYNIGPNQTRVGAIVYSDSSTVSFNFEQHTTLRSVDTAVGVLTHPGGATQTHLALNDAKTMFTSPVFGARVNDPAIPKVCLLITDGAASSTLATSNSASVLRNEGVSIFAIGAGSVDIDQLDDAGIFVLVLFFFKKRGTE